MVKSILSQRRNVFKYNKKTVRKKNYYKVRNWVD